MDNKIYAFRNSTSKDLENIKVTLDKVFTEEEGVGNLALVATESMPGISDNSWYLIEDNNKKIVSLLAQVSWDIRFNDIKLNVWEQAIVGTLKEHCGNGLMTELNRQLDISARENSVDMIMIQGIPGFYNKFGYRYAIDFENHINIDLDRIKGRTKNSFREADINDIPLFIEQEKFRKEIFSLQSYRNEKSWHYLLNDSKQTEYSSDVWIMDEKYFVKIQKEGFGDGLIISEISEGIPLKSLKSLLSFLKLRAREREKPYIRFDLSEKGALADNLLKLGASVDSRYGWQVKIVDVVSFLNKIKPVLEVRIKNSSFNNFKGALSITISNKPLVIEINNSHINNIYYGEYENALNIILPKDLMEPLFLGYKNLKELQYIRPDLFSFDSKAIELTEVIFPKLSNWLYSIW